MQHNILTSMSKKPRPAVARWLPRNEAGSHAPGPADRREREGERESEREREREGERETPALWSQPSNMGRFKVP